MEDKEKLIHDLNNADEYDVFLFPKLVSRTIAYLNVENKYIAEIFTTSIPTIGRWINGVSSPHPVMRKAVYKKFIELILAYQE